MTSKRLAAILWVTTFAFISILANQSASADWGVSFYGEVSSPQYSYYGDRLTTEYRRGYQVDDWIERGASSVTESPIFSDGVRLASWATQYNDDFDFGLASAVYFFEVPDGARSVRVKVYYEGEADRNDFSGGIAGRVWVKRAYIGDDYTEYYPDEGRYDDEDDALYGDTFVLRANKHLEILRMSAEDHVVDGMMELHVVAEGRQRIDVKYIEVESFSYMPSVRVVNRYYRDYAWQPWYDYTYWNFYTGPIFYFSDHYYVRYTYPHYRQNYITIRSRYNNYLKSYYVRRPEHRVRWANISHVSRGAHRTWERDRLNRWTKEYDDARRSYAITSARQKPDEVQKTRTRVRSVLSSRTRVSPATVRAQSGITTGAPSVQRRATTIERSTNTSATSRRSESPTIQRQEQSRTSSALRRQTETSRSTRQPTERVETTTRTGSTNSSVRSSVRTRSTSTDRSTESSVKRSPTRSTSESQTRQSREVKSRTETRKSESSPKRAPSTSNTQTKKDDDEDDDKKSTTTRSSSSTSSSTTRKSVRTRTR